MQPMGQRRQHGRRIRLVAALALASVALAGFAPAAHAQSGSGATPPRNKRPVRRPVIDLERAARQPRPGQILPEEELPAPPTQPEVQPAPEPAGTPPPRAAEPAEAPASPATPPTTPPPANTEPTLGPVAANVIEVSGPASQVQWRLADAEASGDEWEPIAAGATRSGRLEVRTGLSGAVTLTIDDQAALRFGRLSRAKVERRVVEGRPELVVRLSRGRVVVEPQEVDALGLAKTPVRIVTPAGTAVRRVAVEVVYDAMNGMRETVLKRE